MSHSQVRNQRVTSQPVGSRSKKRVRDVLGEKLKVTKVTLPQAPRIQIVCRTFLEFEHGGCAQTIEEDKKGNRFLPFRAGPACQSAGHIMDLRPAVSGYLVRRFWSSSSGPFSKTSALFRATFFSAVEFPGESSGRALFGGSRRELQFSD